jgi:mono/diheme cytochrome c family protein
MGFFRRELSMRRETAYRQPERGTSPRKAHGTVDFLGWLWAAVLLAITLCISTSAQSEGATSVSSDLPPGDGKAVVERACTTCHTTGLISRKRATAAEWSATVDEMVNRGAELNDEEIVAVSHYLASSFPTTSNSNHSDTSSSVKIKYK